jgi:4-hydroxy-tetrahydrodipicolinate synthase
MLAYDASYATQTPIAIETVVELAEEGTLVGIKDSGSFADFRHLLIELRHLPEFSVLTGHELLADAAFLIGAAGCVPTIGNLIPATYAKIKASAERGDWAAARKYQEQAILLRNIERTWEPMCICGKLYGSSKTILRLLGVIDCSNPGYPYSSPTPEQESRVRADLEHLGLLKPESVLLSRNGR